MKKNILILAGIVMLFLMFSCGSGKGDKLTERIQYDVTIKSPEQNLEWWVQNLEGPKREKLVQAIINSARSGKVKVYDVMSNKELDEQQIKAQGTRTELLTLQRPQEPYEEYDTVIRRELQLSDITRLRFLEQWYLNEGNGKITKEVLAICPLVESYTEEGTYRGHQPLFWISYNKKFPLETR
ncbi:MAG: hypothetical protein KUL83_04955 [Lentimicrobium sp.]|jgi:hypothetical protein|nr:hypothetical protein [Lentimicrobium sp.]MDD4598162.1 hypothetical protein [Lentimicrobiaceae bacterium]MDY0025240.1 hypothetical protein [Lentimicrobium sp.]